MREFRANMAAFLRRAQAGERVTVTVDGRPVATLGPASADHVAATIDDLVARGALLPPRRRGDFVVTEPVAMWSGVRIDRAVREVRS
jgi:prevent-host-death family protein